MCEEMNREIKDVIQTKLEKIKSSSSRKQRYNDINLKLSRKDILIIRNLRIKKSLEVGFQEAN